MHSGPDGQGFVWISVPRRQLIGCKSHKAAIFSGEPAVRVMLASFISQPSRGLSDRPHLSVGDIAVQLVAQPDVDAPIP